MKYIIDKIKSPHFENRFYPEIKDEEHKTVYKVISSFLHLYGRSKREVIEWHDTINENVRNLKNDESYDLIDDYFIELDNRSNTLRFVNGNFIEDDVFELITLNDLLEILEQWSLQLND